ncbi:MAG TPA: hypothetical protein VH374_21690 [Polyangia bacterium]|jgi:hypothetical protein|nr:hypothetical protein [Polyangia bacterium]
MIGTHDLQVQWTLDKGAGGLVRVFPPVCARLRSPGKLASAIVEQQKIVHKGGFHAQAGWILTIQCTGMIAQERKQWTHLLRIEPKDATL